MQIIKKCISGLLTTAIILGLCAIGPKTTEVQAEAVEKNNVVVDKTIELQSDGNYMLTLSAYATGEDSITPTEKAIPLDIVLVLDQSGSMKERFGNTWDSYIKKIDALRNAVNGFLASVKENALKDPQNPVEHRVAIIGFAGSSSKPHHKNNEIFVGEQQYQYGTQQYSNNLNKVFQNITNTANYNNLTSSIKELDNSGATYADTGMAMAKDVLDNNPIPEGSDRKQVVIMFTDGEPNHGNGFDKEVANAAIKNSKKIKTGGTDVYTIGIFEDADAEDTRKQTNRYMHYVSSNYPTADNLDSPSNGLDKNKGFYKTASSSKELENIFETISGEITTPTTKVQLDENAVLRDVLNTTNFRLPEATIANDIKVYTADSKTINDEITWEEPVEFQQAKVSITQEKTIDVSGFSYKDYFVTKSHEGKKLIVKIPLNALDSGVDMDSNTSDSGIYDKADATGIKVATFPQPKVTIPEKSYVLDFGKKAATTSSDYGLSQVSKLSTKNYAKPSEVPSVKKKYGTYLKENTSLSYQVQAINWDGYDSGFVFGNKIKTSNEYDWAKVNFIPANSVYYEDDFNITSETEQSEDTNIRIVYSGNYKTIGKSQSDIQSSDNKNYGSDASYNDDSTYSNGSATQMTSPSEDQAATAKFTFTGTGIDIYSRTDTKTAMVSAMVTNEAGDIVDLKFVDTVYENGDKNITSGADGELYQIPTFSINLEEYGKSTYTVELTVGAPAGENQRCTYYLDGIRIYNPLGAMPTDKKAAEAYKEADEYASAVLRLRDILLEIEDTKEIAQGGVSSGKTNIAYIDNIEATKDGDGNISLNADSLNGYKDYMQYGPKSEVYLAPGNAVTFQVNKNYGTDKSKYMLGMKSPTGKSAAVTYTDGENTKNIPNLKSATDMYYVIKPTAEGYITVKNTGNKLISLTKFKMTQVKANNKSGLISVSTDVLNYTAKVFSDSMDSEGNMMNHSSDVVNKITTEKGIPASQALKEETSTKTTESSQTTKATDQTFDGKVTIQNVESTKQKNVTDVTTIWTSVKSSVAQYLKSK